MSPHRLISARALSLGRAVMHLVLVALLLVASAPARADEPGHVILTGYASRCGTLTDPGATSTCVYLFIDEIEGRIDLALPPDATLTLERNGVALPSFSGIPVVANRSPAEVATFYAAPSESRRLAQTMVALDGALAGDDPVTAATFAPRLAAAAALFAGLPLPARPLPPHSPADLALIDNLQLRTFIDLAARVDVNVARARNRAFVDTAPPALTTPLVLGSGPDAVSVPVGSVFYRLVAQDSFGRTADLGRVLVSLAPFQLPRPATFLDVSHDQSRCDAPEWGRSHGNVALTWDHPGAGATERQAQMRNTVGYDLWRKAGRCSDPGTVDLAALMRTADGSSPDGRLLVPGFVQVNDLPLILRDPPASGRESDRPGWNAAFSQWVDDAQALTSAGFSPGDQVCYYVVGLDRTGNYGVTAGLVARVPDQLEPVGPWDATAVLSSEATADITPVADTVYDTTVTTEDDFFLEWSAVDVPNWVNTSAFGRVACNPVEARVTGRLDVADTADGCESPTTFNLDVERYVIYRFTSPDVAGRFMDSDGDGHADHDEGTTAENQGAACNPNVAGGGVDHRATGPFEVVNRDDGTRRIRWRDNTPGGPVDQKGTEFWYRVASVGTNGRTSALSAPIRGIFFDKTKPERLTNDEIRFGFCGPDVYPNPVPDVQAWAFDTTGQAATLRIFCRPLGEGPIVEGGPVAPDAFLTRISSWLGDFPYVEVDESHPTEGRVVYPDRERVCPLAASSTCRLEADVVDPRGRVIGQVVIPDDQDCAFTVESHTSCDAGFVEVDHGSVVDEPLTLTLPLADGECAGVFSTINEQRFRLTTLCGPNNKTLVLPTPSLGPARTCLSVTVYSEGGRVPSTDTPLPCTTQIPPGKVPPPPRLSALALPADTPNATLTWAGPDQAIAGIIIEFWDKATPTRTTAFFQADKVTGDQTPYLDEFPLGGVLPAGLEQEWCVRAQAVSAGTPKDLGGKLSEWTTPLCGLRRHAPNTALPEYIRWPAQKTPTRVTPDLVLEELRRDELLVVRMGTIASGHPQMPRGVVWSEDESELCENACGCAPPPCNPTVSQCLCISNTDCGRSQPTGTTTCDLCPTAISALGDNRRFIAYRQSRLTDPDGDGPLSADVGPWVQASPLIDKPWCTFDAYRANNRDVNARMWDPYFALVAFAAPGAPVNEPEYRVYFTDRLPSQVGVAYRFQFVFFDEDGEPMSYRQTQWLEIPL